MTTWLALAFSGATCLATVAVTYGIMRAKIDHLAESLRDLRTTLDKLADRVTVLSDRIGDTGTHNLPPPRRRNTNT